MSKIKEIEELRKTWKAREDRAALKEEVTKTAQAISIGYGLSLALSILKQPSNTQMHAGKTPRCPDEVNMTVKQICPHCKDEIPPDWVQQGGLHMGCYEEKMEVFFISLPHNPDSGFMEADIKMVSEVLLNIEEPHLITRKKVAAGQYYNAPEFEGF